MKKATHIILFTVSFLVIFSLSFIPQSTAAVSHSKKPVVERYKCEPEPKEKVRKEEKERKKPLFSLSEKAYKEKAAQTAQVSAGKEVLPFQEGDTFFVNKNEYWSFTAGAHIRTSFKIQDNLVTLDKRDDFDYDYYFAYAYDFTLDLRHVSGFEIYSFIERRGRADYDAPFDGLRPINTIFGQYEWYRDSNMEPIVRELWLEIPLSTTKNVNFKFGLFPYGREIGHKIALGGKYENWGFQVSGKHEYVDWNLHFEAEDFRDRILIGRKPNFDQARNIYNVESAYFSAADTTIRFGRHSFQAYLGWLSDSTSSNARTNLFNTPVKNEDLFTAGFYATFNVGKLSLGLEGARNFGSAKADAATPMPDIEHTGYMMIGDVSYDLGAFKPKASVQMASGNKLDNGQWNVGTLPLTENHAFSVFSPLHYELFDTHYQKGPGPFVAMARSFAVNFGIRRPGTFGDPFILENLAAYSCGFDYTPIDKVYIGLDYWYLQAMESGIGWDVGMVPMQLPKELGSEIDLFVSYQLTKNVKLSFLGGYFFPGAYNKQRRIDTNVFNVFSPASRRDGKADGAYLTEFSLDLTF